MGRAKLARRAGTGAAPIDLTASGYGGRAVGTLTAAERAAELSRILDAPAAVPSRQVALDDLDDDALVQAVETARAHRQVRPFANWLAQALCGSADSDVLLRDAIAGRVSVGWGEPAALALALPAWCEAELVARITYHELYEDRPDEPEVTPPRDAAEAVAMGLSLRRKRRRKPKTPTLPGCGGGFLVGPGYACPELRVVGHDMCPACEHAFTARVRADAEM
ncbi:MAG: hypothetical protein JWO31_4285 [Phycisphaerales bacterium]|nr:hypothetical protein [Phycisphaerales bacterium]